MCGCRVTPWSAMASPTTEDNEEARAFLQARLALFWKVLFLFPRWFLQRQYINSAEAHAQFDKFDEECGLSNDTELRTVTYGDTAKWVGRLGDRIKASFKILEKLLAKTGSGGGAV